MLLEEEKKELVECQLWWDKELINLNTEEKKIFHIKKIISWVLKSELKQVLKSAKLSNEFKQDLLSWMKIMS